MQEVKQNLKDDIFNIKIQNILKPMYEIIHFFHMPAETQNSTREQQQLYSKACMAIAKLVFTGPVFLITTSM